MPVSMENTFFRLSKGKFMINILILCFALLNYYTLCNSILNHLFKKKKGIMLILAEINERFKLSINCLCESPMPSASLKWDGNLTKHF